MAIKQVISLSLEPRFYGQLRRLARRRGTTVQTVIREAAQKELERHGTQKEGEENDEQ